MKQSRRVVRPWRWRVRELAEEQGLSIGEIAQRAGISRSTVQAFFRDPQHGTTTEMWSRLAQAFGVPTAELIELVIESEQPPEHP